jgi:bis(5'-nucleosyl)-tetraphosphatase (symmetrical)
MKFGKITIIHAGLQNQYNLDNLSKSEKSKILRLRFVTKDNKFIPFGEENSDSVFWSDIYDGKQGFVIYGHQWFDSVNIDTNSLGVDTGCVYGNKLSGAVFNSPDNHKLYKIFSTRGANNPAV